MIKMKFALINMINSFCIDVICFLPISCISYSYLSEKVLVVAALYCFVLRCFCLGALARRTMPIICSVASIIHLAVPSSYGSIGCIRDTTLGVIDWDLRDYHAGHITLAARLSGRFASIALRLCLRSSLLPLLLMG